MQNIPKILLAVLAQAISFALLYVLVGFLPFFTPPPYNPLILTLLMGLFASILSYLIRLPKWWLGLQISSPVAIYLVLQTSTNPWLYLVFFIVIWLFFSNSTFNRVPLYLTNNKTRQALAQLASSIGSVSFIDLGSGLGGNVTFMSKQQAVVSAKGVETAPLPYFISKINCLFNGGVISAQSFWNISLTDYNLVYAFLSPDPMAKLWVKAIKDMDKNAVFVSNSFAIKNVVPSEIWELDDARKTHLYIYNLADFKND